RFGSYGLSGVIFFRVEPPVLAVDTFLLSCRALGRGVEHRMVARLCEIALERGLKTVDIPFVAAQRNRPAQLFLESLGVPADGGVFRFPAKCAPDLLAPAISPAPADAPRPEAHPAPVSPPPASPPYARIAAELPPP